MKAREIIHKCKAKEHVQVRYLRCLTDLGFVDGSFLIVSSLCDMPLPLLWVLHSLYIILARRPAQNASGQGSKRHVIRQSHVMARAGSYVTCNEGEWRQL